MTLEKKFSKTLRHPSQSQKKKIIITNLNGADLSVTDLSSADLSYANLIGTNLMKANLSRTKVEKACLSKNLGLSEEVKLNLTKRGAIVRKNLTFCLK